MTGMRPTTTGVYGLRPWFREVDELSGLVTIPQYFENNGYSTYMAGKIFHGRYGYADGDSEVQHLGPPQSVGARPEKKLVSTPQDHPLMDWGVFPHKDEDKGDWQVASWAVEQLESDLPEPFFLSKRQLQQLVDHPPDSFCTEMPDLFRASVHAIDLLTEWGAREGGQQEEPAELRVIDSARLLMADVGTSLGSAKKRVSEAANGDEFKTNAKKGPGRRIDRDSFNTWLREKRVKYLKRSDKWSAGVG